MRPATKEQAQDDFFLPRFCGLPMLFAVMVLAELFAFVLTLARVGGTGDSWWHLSLNSLFMQWAAITGTIVLCVTRPLLLRMGNKAAALVSYLLLLLVVVLLSEAAYLFLLPRAELVIGSIDHMVYLLRNLGIGAIAGGLGLRYFYVQHQWKRKMNAEAQARVEALQARIRPHFLFNSMNTIASLTREQPDLAEEVIEDLSDLFRASLGDERRLIPLAEEMLLVRRYLHIESLRLGKRLKVQWHVADGVEHALVPPLSLQPLAENAVYHGIEPAMEGGTVSIRARREGEYVYLEVTNPAPGQATARRPGNQMALDNIRARLGAQYGAKASLSIAEQEGVFCVLIKIPYKEERHP